MTARIRVLVVEDSLTVRRRICEVLATDPEIEVIAEADDGHTAIERCAALRPDVITMDMVLPTMSGLAATEHIMGYSPTPILIVSSSTNRGELFKTYDALAAGALDVLEKPRGDGADAEWETTLISRVKLLSRIRVITHPRARLRGGASSGGPSTRSSRGASSSHGHRLAAIGASTGGPGALVTVLGSLPLDFHLPVLVVLHLAEPFAAHFAEWLAEQTGRSVAYAGEAAPLSGIAGTVVLAPPGRHMVVRGGRIHLTSAPERHSCRPSVDELFESIARDCGPHAAGCLLTGMGRDGASGLLAMRRAGGLTIAQDERSSVVFGMPREAIRIGAAERVLPLEEIAGALASLGGA